MRAFWQIYLIIRKLLLHPTKIFQTRTESYISSLFSRNFKTSFLLQEYGTLSKLSELHPIPLVEICMVTIDFFTAPIYYSYRDMVLFCECKTLDL